MDYSVRVPGGGSDAIVVWANRYQCAPGEVVRNRAVESRALVWGNSGVGAVVSGGAKTDLTPSTFVFLPWRHDIDYLADQHDPFMVSAIHIIPWHDPRVPVELHAAHGQHDRLAGVPYRRDLDWPDLRGAIRGETRGGDRLLALADFTTRHVQSGSPDRESLHALATLLLNELRASLAIPAGSEASMPPKLVRMQQFVVSHLHQPLTVAQIAAAGAVSESSAERLFRQHTGMSVGRWLTAERMRVARDLLRTTNSSVSEVAKAVGFTDASYFSRAFRRSHGLAPSSYAARGALA